MKKQLDRKEYIDISNIEDKEERVRTAAVMMKIWRSSEITSWYFRRIIAVIFSAVMLTVTFIPVAVVSLVILIIEGQSPLYTVEIAGRRGKTFKQHRFGKRNDENPSFFAFLPAFYDVLRGKMSIIGPSSRTPEEVKKFNTYQKISLLYNPGITGTWRHTSDWENLSTEEKIEIDICYVKNRTLCGDILRVFRYQKFFTILLLIMIILSGCVQPAHAGSESTETGNGSSAENSTELYEAEMNSAIAKTRQLVWSEEFDEESLQSSNWAFSPKMQMDGIKNVTDEEHAELKNGELVLRTDLSEDGKSYVTSESISTEGKMCFRYGYLEMRAKLPYETGAWPSLWMQSDGQYRQADYLAEVDLVESLGLKDGFCSSLHKWYLDTGENYCTDDEDGDDNNYCFSSQKVAADYHTYGFEWTEDSMAFSVDGEIFFERGISDKDNFGTGNMEGFRDPMFIILNNYVLTDAAEWSIENNRVSKETEFPFFYYIDYIRLYQGDNEELFLN